MIPNKEGSASLNSPAAVGLQGDWSCDQDDSRIIEEYIRTRNFQNSDHKFLQFPNSPIIKLITTDIPRLISTPYCLPSRISSHLQSSLLIMAPKMSYQTPAAPPNTPTETSGHVAIHKDMGVPLSELLKDAKAALDKQQHDRFIDLVTDCMAQR